MEGGSYTKIGGMWNLKHEIGSPELYELHINKELKGGNYLDLKYLYNQINTCINDMDRIQ